VFRTLHISRPGSFRVFVYTFLLFLLLMGGVETALRAAGSGHSDVAVWFGNPLIATRYTPGIVKLAGFDEQYATEELNCIMIGSSLMEYLDPVAFEQAYTAQTGTPLHCFNYGLMDASTLTVRATLALLAARYDHLALVVWGIQAHMFYFQPQTAEQRYDHSEWVRYASGDFNLTGWLDASSYTFRFVNTYAPLIYATWDSVQPLARTDRDKHLVKGRATRGYTPTLGYKASSPLFDPSPDTVIHYLPAPSTSPTLWDTIPQAGQIAQAHKFKLVIVEMPTYAENTATNAVMDRAAETARRSGIPFLSTRALALPASAFVDTVDSTPQHFIHNHLYVGGSLFFSDWLGIQIGNAALVGAWDRVDDPRWTPGSTAWQLPRAETWGLSEEDFHRCQAVLATSEILPPRAIVFNPDTQAIDRVLVQTSLGYLMTWSDAPDSPEWRAHCVAIGLLDRMRYADELSQTGNAAALAAWQQDPLANLLRSQRIDAVICREELARPAVEHCPPVLRSSPDYVQLGTWPVESFYEQYILYSVKK
jgi:hypothetical protein